jgi:hypothetical protein
MSITMILEIGEAASAQSILSAVQAVAGSKPSEDGSAYVGNFDHSNMYFKIDVSPRDKAVTAEDVDALQDVPIGARIIFSVVPSQYEKCVEQITELMNVLAKTTQAKFVLSQEYETVYAVRSNSDIDYKCSFFNEA